MNLFNHPIKKFESSWRSSAEATNRPSSWHHPGILLQLGPWCEVILASSCQSTESSSIFVRTGDSKDPDGPYGVTWSPLPPFLYLCPLSSILPLAGTLRAASALFRASRCLMIGFADEFLDFPGSHSKRWSTESSQNRRRSDKHHEPFFE